MKHVFILNPAAGKGLAEKEVLPLIQRAMKETGLDYEIHRSLSRGDIESYVAQRARTGEEIRFYACGGDGTLNNVLNGMAEYPNAQLACVPCGSGNDFVKNFTETDNFKDIKKLLAGHIEKIDVIKYNNAYGINMFNVGMDCDVVAEKIRLQEAGTFKGAAAYLAAAVKVIGAGGSYKMTYIDENGEEQTEDLMLTAVANGIFCGGGFKSCPKANLRDGLMDVGMVRPCKGADLVRLFVKYHNGTHLSDKKADKYIRYIQVPEFTLKPASEFNVSVDGEILPFEETRFSVVLGAVSFVVPEGSEIL